MAGKLSRRRAGGGRAPNTIGTSLRRMIVAAFVVSIVAVLISGGSLWFASRQTDEAARSRVAAETSANAAVDAAKAASRQLEIAEAEAAKYVPPWTLRWDSGDTYLLANDGDSTEYGVTLSAADELIARMPDAGKAVDPRSGITFLAARHMGTTDDTITVTWHRHPDLSDEARTWRHPLPNRLL